MMSYNDKCGERVDHFELGISNFVKKIVYVTTLVSTTNTDVVDLNLDWAPIAMPPRYLINHPKMKLQVDFSPTHFWRSYEEQIAD